MTITTSHKTRFVKMSPTDRVLAAYVHQRENGVEMRDAVIRLWTFIRTWSKQDRKVLTGLIRDWENTDVPDDLILSA